MGHDCAMTDASWRRLIGIILVVALCIISYFAIQWVWRDITYWSRSTTVECKTATLEECVRLAVSDWPDVSAVVSAPIIKLQVPAQEGVIVKDTPTPQVARIVVYGHSESVSYLGPSAEEPVTELIRQLSRSMSARCGH
jgi:hypothetical protein